MNYFKKLILVPFLGFCLLPFSVHAISIAQPERCHPTEYEKRWASNFIWDVKRDYCEYFKPCNLLWVGNAFIASGILANTGADRTVADDWQTYFRSSWTNSFFSPFKAAGGLSYYYAPAYLVFMGIGHMREHTLLGNTVYHWAYRSLRTVILGGPQQLFFTYALGSGRPSRNEDSKWQPFRYNTAVSGHTFYGAIPFLSAAMMTDPPLLRYSLFIMSTLPGLSRINSNAHYASQVLLAWSLAYLSALSVYNSDLDRRPMFQVGVYPRSEGVMLAARFQF